MTIKKNSQNASQADKQSKLNVIGETTFTVTRDNHKLRCDALVATDLGEDVLGATVFQSRNDCYAPPKQKLVYIGSDSYPYRPNQQDPVNSCGRIYTHPVKLSETTTIWPSEHIDITLPDDFVSDDEYAIEPRTTSKLNNSMSLPNMWPSPNILQAVGGKLRFSNATTDPIILKNDDQFCHVRPTTVFSNPTLFVNDSTPTVKLSTVTPYSSVITLDPDEIMDPKWRQKFTNQLLEHDVVFNPTFQGYSGPVKANVNMKPVQTPQRKGKMPLCNTLMNSRINLTSWNALVCFVNQKMFQ